MLLSADLQKYSWRPHNMANLCCMGAAMDPPVLCWCRKLPGARDKEGYAAEVLATLEEGKAAQAALGTSFRSWQMPVAALMALQKNGWGQPGVYSCPHPLIACACARHPLSSSWKATKAFCAAGLQETVAAQTLEQDLRH